MFLYLGAIIEHHLISSAKAAGGMGLKGLFNVQLLVEILAAFSKLHFFVLKRATLCLSELFTWDIKIPCRSTCCYHRDNC